MQAARAAGFRVKVLHVSVSLETAQRRNAKRDRVVPLGALREYERRLEVAIRILGREEADDVEVVDNNVDTVAPSAQ